MILEASLSSLARTEAGMLTPSEQVSEAAEVKLTLANDAT